MKKCSFENETRKKKAGKNEKEISTKHIFCCCSLRQLLSKRKKKNHLLLPNKREDYVAL
jgi:hypothetical protein